jgi:hypothetical protein
VRLRLATIRKQLTGLEDRYALTDEETQAMLRYAAYCLVRAEAPGLTPTEQVTIARGMEENLFKLARQGLIELPTQIPPNRAAPGTPAANSSRAEPPPPPNTAPAPSATIPAPAATIPKP